MWNIIKENRFFFGAFTLFFVVASVLLFTIEQGDAILFFSQHRSPVGDFFFRYMTKVGEEFFYFFIFGTLLFVRFRYAILVPLLGVLVTIVSLLSKSYFGHDRPYTYFKNIDQLDQVNLLEGIQMLKGATSFPSGHTMSAFALYGLMAFLVGWKRSLGLFFFAIAFLIGISRIYLVQHFLKDVYLGSILGVFIALLLYWSQKKIPNRPNGWLDRSLLNSSKKESV